MVSQTYMTARPERSGAIRRAFNQEVIADLVNLAGRVEGVLMRASQQTRRRPHAALFLALACGYVVAGSMRRS